MTSPRVWELYAVKYGTLIERMRRESFVKLDPHDDGPMPIDYYVWVAVSPEQTIVIDTGFDDAEATKRSRSLIRSVTEGLATIGVDAVSASPRPATSSVAAGPFWAETTDTRPDTRA